MWVNSIQCYLCNLFCVYLSRFPNMKCEDNAKSTEKSSLQLQLYYPSGFEFVLSSFGNFYVALSVLVFSDFGSHEGFRISLIYVRVSSLRSWILCRTQTLESLTKHGIVFSFKSDQVYYWSGYMVSFPCLYFNIKVHNGLETAKLNLVTRTITVQIWEKDLWTDCSSLCYWFPALAYSVVWRKV